MQVAGVEYPVPAFSEPHWGAVEEKDAPQECETAAVPDRLDEDMTRRVPVELWEQ